MKLSTRSAFILATLLGAFAYIGGTGLTVSSAWLITMASEHPPVLVLSVAIVMVRFFGIFRSLARYSERVISHEAVFRKLTGLRRSLFEAIASRLSEINVAQMSKSIVDDVERAQEFHLRVTLPGISAVLSGAVTALIALWIEPRLLFWVLPALAIFAVVIPYLTRTLLDPLARELEIKEGEYAEVLASASFAIVEADAFGYRDQYQSQLGDFASCLRQLEQRFYNRLSLLQFAYVAVLGLTLFGTSKTVDGITELLPVQISMAVFLVLVGFEGFTTWFPNLFPAGKNRRAAASVSELSRRTHSQHSSSAPSDGFAITAQEFSPYWESAFLAPVSFTLGEGETLVLSGPSGIGKSTFASALFGFASYSGSFTIGGVELRDISDRSQLISGSLQSGHIFNTTVRENLKFAGDDIKDDQIREMLNALDLNYLSLDEVIGEFGRALSGGEAKRLSTARALLSDAPICILDEPLEHLDVDLADKTRREIERFCAGRTLIVITHSPWPQYSQKLVLARE
jgi:ABC-type transport system involved in cytochrome bd biosynthesis fused ATPase/permease subunit